MKNAPLFSHPHDPPFDSKMRHVFFAGPARSMFSSALILSSSYYGDNMVALILLMHQSLELVLKACLAFIDPTSDWKNQHGRGKLTGKKSGHDLVAILKSGREFNSRMLTDPDILNLLQALTEGYEGIRYGENYYQVGFDSMVRVYIKSFHNLISYYSKSTQIRGAATIIIPNSFIHMVRPILPSGITESNRGIATEFYFM